MASNGQSYPSPDAAQVTGGAAPFYGHSSASNAANELRADMELSAELQRATAPLIARNQEDQAHHHAARSQTPAQPQNPNDALTEPLPSYQHQHHYGLPDVADIGSAQGKRQKASRACDGCRQKKIKCDISTDPSEQCRNCKKAGIPCEFTRQQLKRGPSKGYIKDLADRVQSLEQSLNPFHNQSHTHDTDFSYVQNLASFNGVNATTEPTPTNPRKRTYSASQGIHELSMAQQDGFRLPSAPPQDGTRDSQPPQDDDDDWFMDLPQEPALPEWNFTVVTEYYERMHQLLPFLPKTVAQLRQRMIVCRPTLRKAFGLALECFVRSCPASKLPQDGDFREQFQTASKLLQSWHYEDPLNAAFHSSLVYVQALVLMHLACENQVLHTKHPLAARGEWLARAVGQSKHLRLEEPRSRDTILDGDMNQDTDERLARRIFYTIYVLDQYHAVSLCQSAHLPDYGIAAMHEDTAVLGPELLFLKRSALILGELAKIVKTCSLRPPDSPLGRLDPAGRDAAILTGATDAALALLADTGAALFPTLPAMELLHHHAHLLLHRLRPAVAPATLLPSARRIVDLLRDAARAPGGPAAGPVAPLAHHALAHAALTLDELASVAATRADAVALLADLLTLFDDGAVPVRADGEDWHSAVRALCRRKYRVCAGAASGEGGAAPDADEAASRATAVAVAAELQLGEGYDPREAVMYGYLRYLDRHCQEGTRAPGEDGSAVGLGA